MLSFSSQLLAYMDQSTEVASNLVRSSEQKYSSANDFDTAIWANIIKFVGYHPCNALKINRTSRHVKNDLDAFMAWWMQTEIWKDRWLCIMHQESFHRLDNAKQARVLQMLVDAGASVHCQYLYHMYHMGGHFKMLLDMVRNNQDLTDSLFKYVCQHGDVTAVQQLITLTSNVMHGYTTALTFKQLSVMDYFVMTGLVTVP